MIAQRKQAEFGPGSLRISITPCAEEHHVHNTVAAVLTLSSSLCSLQVSTYSSIPPFFHSLPFRLLVDHLQSLTHKQCTHSYL